jgi:hypothetical protein
MHRGAECLQLLHELAPRTGMAQQVLHEPERLARPDAWKSHKKVRQLGDGIHRSSKYQVSRAKYQVSINFKT